MSKELPIKCEVQRWRTRTLDNGSTKKTLEPLSETPGSKETYALVADRIHDRQGQVASVTLQVNSPHILKAFRDAIGKHYSVPSDFARSTILESPFQMLIHHWDDLIAYKEKTEADETRMHVALLIQWMENELGQTKAVLDAQRQSGSIFYKTCWALFKPGDPVVIYDKSHPWVLTVKKTAYEENVKEGPYMEVHCTFTDHDGIRAGVASHMVKIIQKQYFGQESPSAIVDLPVYPRLYDKAGEELEHKLYERGLEFLDISKEMTVRRYDGLAIYLKVPPPTYWHPAEAEDWMVWMPYTETGRIVADRKLYDQEVISKLVSWKAKLEKKDIIQCPPSVYGYSCAIKEWCRFFMANLLDPDWKPDPFKDLVLAPDTKDLVQALVSSHRFPDDARDRALQKGKGLVCLLHGPPGSGKTLTAECSAELTHRALFSCSLSEINKYNEPHSFERRLSKILHLATNWKAVVLLDEADVFLESRQDHGPADGDRNALVAVFLKQLEYFSGIIFLTTNRIQVFDAAMQSRVHLALGYTEPDRAARRTLWKSQIAQSAPDIVGKELEDVLDLVDVELLNGREIANFVQTASTLARYHSESLQTKHLQTILRVRKDFLLSLRRKKETLVARATGLNRVGSWPARQNSILEQEPEEM